MIEDIIMEISHMTNCLSAIRPLSRAMSGQLMMAVDIALFLLAVSLQSGKLGL
jgi:hypothetical protein